MLTYCEINTLDISMPEKAASPTERAVPYVSPQLAIDDPPVGIRDPAEDLFGPS